MSILSGSPAEKKFRGRNARQCRATLPWQRPFVPRRRRDLLKERCRSSEPQGFVEGNGLERGYRDSVIAEIYEGTNDIQRLVIARDLLASSAANLNSVRKQSGTLCPRESCSYTSRRCRFPFPSLPSSLPISMLQISQCRIRARRALAFAVHLDFLKFSQQDFLRYSRRPSQEERRKSRQCPCATIRWNRHHFFQKGIFRMSSSVKIQIGCLPGRPFAVF